jgi:hypothetical protein
MSSSADILPQSKSDPTIERPSALSRAIVPLLLAGFAALAWAIYPGQWVAWTTAIASGWIAAYRLGCDKIGTLLWCVAAGLASGPICIVVTHSTFDNLSRESPIAVTALPLLIVAGLRFLWAARKTTLARGPNAAMVVVSVFTLIIPASVAATISRVRDCDSEYQETTQMLLGLHQVASDIDAFRKARGRVPNDEDELVAWRGSPMPSWSKYGNVRLMLLQNGGYQLDSNTHGFWGYANDWAPYIVVYSHSQSFECIHIDPF